MQNTAPNASGKSISLSAGDQRPHACKPLKNHRENIFSNADVDVTGCIGPWTAKHG